MSLVTLSVLFTVSLIAEMLLLLTIKRSTLFQHYISAGVVALLGFMFSVVLFSAINLWSIVFLSLVFFRVLNVMRVAVARMNAKELYSRYRKSLLYFGAISIIVLIFISSEQLALDLTVALWGSVVLSCVLLVNLIINLLRFRGKPALKNNLEKLPTVSICIPARNETQDLPECIESLLASSYPKLEILVLDDCSHDKTPAVIKEYAHKGVRFLSGQEPSSDWLAKNKAMNKLFDESTGEIVIFAGVDVRFSPETVLRIVEQLSNGHDMISVLPKRSNMHESSLFIQPIRYWWELAVPRSLGGRPPVLSTCWAIHRKKLHQLGEFDSYKKSVQPEAHFAHRLKDTYAFIISGNRFGLTSIKKPKEQLDTAIRTRYPQTRHRPEVVFALLCVEFLVFSVPIIGLIVGLNQSTPGLLYPSIVGIFLLGITSALVARLVVSKTWPIGFVSWPFLYVLETYVLLRSFTAYEYGSVIWKERNICLPMLTVEKKLPKI